MIRNLKAYKLLSGYRGKEKVDENQFAEIVQRISALVQIAPEIEEMDINPLMGGAHGITAVDTRILLKH